MLDQVTPVILTYNEAANIGRTLDKLRWATEIIVVDSGSTDETLAIAARFANCRVVEHPLTSLAEQWNFAFHETGVRTEWILRLDADYIVSDALIEEMSRLVPTPDVGGYRVNFVYCVHGIPLRGSIYPADYKLVRRQGLEAYQDGHTERLRFPGQGLGLKGHIFHDDRKPIGRWLWSQDRYMIAEAAKLCSMPPSRLDFMDKLRKTRILAPILVFLYCLFAKRLILDGRAGLYYTFQRTIAEMILALNLLDADLRREADAAASPSRERNPNR